MENILMQGIYLPQICYNGIAYPQHDQYYTPPLKHITVLCVLLPFFARYHEQN